MDSAEIEDGLRLMRVIEIIANHHNDEKLYQYEKSNDTDGFGGMGFGIGLMQ